MRLDGLSHGDSPAEPKALVMIFAEAGAELVTFSVHTWPRADVSLAVERIVSSFEIVSDDRR